MAAVVGSGHAIRLGSSVSVNIKKTRTRAGCWSIRICKFLEGEGPPEPVRLRTTEIAADVGSGHAIRLGSSVSVNIKKPEHEQAVDLFESAKPWRARGLPSRCG